MADNQYPCPECGTVLRPKNALTPGKKVKCPKCETVFAPVPAESAAPAKPAKAAAKRASDDPDEIGSYGVTSTEDDDKATEKERKRAVGALKDRDRKPRSARGPAQAILTKPTNQLLLTSTITCLGCIITIMATLWPMVFPPPEKKDEDTVRLEEAKKKKEPPKPQMSTGERVGIIVLAVLAFLYDGVIALGAVRAHGLESRTFGMIASIMCLLPFQWGIIIPAFLWFMNLLMVLAGEEFGAYMQLTTLGVLTCWYIYVGAWNIMTLNKPEVIAGFKEKKPVV